MRFYAHCLLPLLLMALWGHPSRGAEETFTQQIAPLLQEHCLDCHNAQDRKSGLSLETKESALAGGDLGAAIVPGDADSSYLLELVTPHEGKAEMPKGAPPLGEAEIAELRDWIEAGAPWPEGVRIERKRWWSRRPLVRPQVPDVADDQRNRVRTPIDSFVIARLAEQDMKLSPEAEMPTLVRRLYYDLIGLPPTPEQIDEVVRSADPQAYEKLVDRLLASPQYGERWARHWFDVVKYADTCGYDKDKLRRNAWPYRDYVIRSLNQDKPYTRFVQEQVAGDALFPGTADGILGLGFLAAGPWDFIGHVEVPEAKIDGKIARNLDRDEMVSNTLNTFCSVTVQCARCHDHKFDPITQEQYYGLQAVFAAIDRAERPYDVDPFITHQRQELSARVEALQRQQTALDAEIEKAGGAELAGLRSRMNELRDAAVPGAIRPEYGYHSAIEPAADQAKWVQVDLGRVVELDRVVLHACYDDFGGIGAGFGFPVRFRIEVSNDEAFAQSHLLCDETTHDFPNPGLVPYVAPYAASARYIRLTATHLAERTNDYNFAISELEALDSKGVNAALGAKVSSLDSIEAPVRWRRTNLVDGIWPHAADPLAQQALANVQSQLQMLEQRINTPERQMLQAELAKQLAAAEKSLKALPAGNMVYAAATHFAPQGNFKPTLGKPRPIHLLHRGNVTDPRDPVQPGTVPLPNQPHWQFDLPTDHNEADRRAALARWLTAKDHPFTWRSIVNRIWLYHFDQAIVSTPNDFGRMGQLPTHPALLDWLAVEFRDGGQSLKALHRLMVTSSVYRQSSDHNAEYTLLDGGNQFLWRMNRRRLEAEEIRDSILAVSGQLDMTMGGPGYFLFELEKEAHSPHYEYQKFDHRDRKSHRRSIYRFIVRSQPDPYMTTLDCADSSQSTARREETLTSLQALSMLNNSFSTVMAEKFAGRLEKEHPEVDAQVRRAAQLVLQRELTAAEQMQLAAYARDHGLANLCLVMFNLSEFVYLD